MIEVGRVETNGLLLRQRKIRVMGGAVEVQAVEAAPEEPGEQPIFMAVYSDRIEMPLSAGVELLERMSNGS